MPKFTEAQLQDVLSEREGVRVNLVCGTHQYVGSKMPPKTQGCKNCWMAYYTYDLASTPPHLRQERLEELETIIHHVAEYEDQGRFDFEAFDPWSREFQQGIRFEKDGDVEAIPQATIQLTDKDN